MACYTIQTNPLSCACPAWMVGGRAPGFVHRRCGAPGSFVVRAAGIEPARLTAADFKSDASTNFAMPAPPGLYYVEQLGC